MRGPAAGVSPRWVWQCDTIAMRCAQHLVCVSHWFASWLLCGSRPGSRRGFSCLHRCATASSNQTATSSACSASVNGTQCAGNSSTRWSRAARPYPRLRSHKPFTIRLVETQRRGRKPRSGPSAPPRGYRSSAYCLWYSTGAGISHDPDSQADALAAKIEQAIGGPVERHPSSGCQGCWRRSPLPIV